MNYTSKYHLPQWEKSDRILMEDFNQMCLSLENGLIQNAQDAAGGSGSAAQAASQAHSAAQNAQSTADAALAKANAAYCSTNKPYAIGSYTGNGKTQTVSVGFTPSFVFVCGLGEGPVIVNQTMGGGTGTTSPYLSIVYGGFSLDNGGGGDYAPAINQSGRSYAYIAFR